MKRAVLTLLSLTAACTCSVPFEIIPFDAGSDGGEQTDAGAMDAGAFDAGAVDAGAPDDAGMRDAGTRDAGTVDAGAPGDAGTLDGGFSTDGGDPCLGLDLNACQMTVGCVPHMCTFCDCTDHVVCASTMTGSTMVCPDCASLQCCRSDGECAGGFRCVGPGQTVCPAQCLHIACVADFNCGSTSEVCAIDACCLPLSLVCVPACTGDSSCAENQICDATLHCVAKGCMSGAECPPFFDCMLGNCGRRGCSLDADCVNMDGSSGYCVNHGCYAKEGTCVLQPQ